MKRRNKILTGLAGLALAAAVVAPVVQVEPAQAAQTFTRESWCITPMKSNILVQSKYVGRIIIYAYDIHGGYIGSKSTNSKWIQWTPGREDVRFVVTMDRSFSYVGTSCHF